MKKTYIIFLSILNFQFSFGQVNLLDDSNGFKNYKLGTNISSYPQFLKFDNIARPLGIENGIICSECLTVEKDFKMTLNKSFSIYYLLPQNQTAFGRDVEDITLITLNNIIVRIIVRTKVCNGTADCSESARLKMEALKDIIISEFGSTSNNYSNKDYFWNGNNVSLRLTFDMAPARTNTGYNTYVYLIYNSKQYQKIIEETQSYEKNNPAKKDY